LGGETVDTKVGKQPGVRELARGQNFLPPGGAEVSPGKSKGEGEALTLRKTGKRGRARPEGVKGRREAFLGKDLFFAQEEKRL